MKSVQQARINKTKFLFENPTEFKAQLIKELEAFIRHCEVKSVLPAVRLNGTSDLDWTRLLPEAFNLPITYYDYTKVASKMRRFIRGELPSNYHLTFSRSESNQRKVREIVGLGGNVAVVFKDMPQTYLGRPVFSGDDTDLRFLDPTNAIIGLTAKGKARKDSSGFVVSA